MLTSTLRQLSFVTVCLFLSQLLWLRESAAIESASPEVYNEVLAAPDSYSNYDQTFRLIEQTQNHKLLMKFLNQSFRDFLRVPPEQQKEFNLPEYSEGLSGPQLFFLFQKLPEFIPLLKSYLTRVTEQNFNDPEIIEFRNQIKSIFNERLQQNNPLIETLIALNNPTEPLLIEPPKNRPGYESIQVFVNHPSYQNPDNPEEGEIAADNLKQVVIDFINGAKKEVLFNVFEFNLQDIGAALVTKNKNDHVSVLGGIDSSTARSTPANTALFDLLMANQSDTFQTVAVDAVGLNHQKIIVRDPGTENAAVLFLSSNFTQSCMGPEGDLVQLPEAKRPKRSLPNANNAVLIKGELPALISKYELRKTLVSKLRGQSGYPISGAFKLRGPPTNDTAFRPSVVMAFSPNGGMGGVNRDIIKRAILKTTGPIWSMNFAFSSPQLEEAIISRAERAKESHFPFKFEAVGDPPFTMRNWSVVLHLAGYQWDDETKTYSENPDAPLRNLLSPSDFSQLRQNIRLDPYRFGEYNIFVDNKPYDVSVKLHHKSFIFPSDGISIAGTSFNPSNNAENNQEQILVIKDRDITKRMAGAFRWLQYGSPLDLAQTVKRRNEFKWKMSSPKGPEAEFMRRTLEQKEYCSQLFLAN